MPFNSVNNCAAYSQNSTVIQDNTFQCTQCATGFWLNTAAGTCVARTILPNSCQTYNPTADLCTSCVTGFFLTTNGQGCVAFPAGIQNCIGYSGPQSCIQCNSGTYLSNNVCVPSTLISNCQVYSANYTCSQCKSGYFLANATSCIVGIASNCANFTSVTVCSVCPPGLGLQTTNGVTSCVQINIPNCINATTLFPFTCNICAQGFYPTASGTCAAVSNSIPNCLIYDTISTCQTCLSGNILNAARTACNATSLATYMDPNCNQSYTLSIPQCSVCNMGYYFNNGTCTQCKNNTQSSGCLLCDPTNGEACLLCSPGYYMDSKGTCIGSRAPIVNDTNTTIPNITKKGVSRAAAVTALTLTVILFDQGFWRKF